MAKSRSEKGKQAQNSSSSSKPLKFDGRTGEGGGQVVRLAVCLAALTGTHIKIENVRGNRPGKNRGGLKAQHVAGIKCLADLTNADVTGCQVGCKTLEFHAKASPVALLNRNILIKSDTAGSIMLVLQTVLPFLIFAGDVNDTPITITIQGGTNLNFSPSFEYFDQVLFPALDRFGVTVEAKLERRGWSLGNRQIGSATFRISPLTPGKVLQAPSWPTEQGAITHIDVSLVVPTSLQATLSKSLLFELDLVFPSVDVHFKLIDDSRHISRMYALLVAHTSTGLRFGKDWLYDEKSKGKNTDELSTRIAQKVVDDLDVEIRKEGVVDEHLQDQLVVFQALATGTSSIPASLEILSSNRERVDHTHTPFGHGSLHTTTARWVASQLLPATKWVDEGRVCTGAGWVWPTPKEHDTMMAMMATYSEPELIIDPISLPLEDEDEDLE